MRHSLKYTICILSLMVAACSHSSDQNPWIPGANNELPMYGGVPHNAAQQAADQKFIHDAVALKGSPEAASDESVLLGFDYLFKRQDASTAMKRFNQAYLLDAGNGGAYQGMAITLLTKDPNSTTQADELFRRAIYAKRVNPGIFADYGRFLSTQHRFPEAIAVLQKGVALDPNYVETGSLLASALYSGGYKKESCPLAKRWQATAQPQIAQDLAQINADPICK